MDDALWKARFRCPSIRGLQLAPGEPSRALISTNVSGVWQLHALDVRSREMRQLTSRDGGVMVGTLGAGGRFVYYHDDTQGDELGHFVRMSFDGGAAESITPELAPYRTFGLAASAGGQRLGFVTCSEGIYRLYVIDVGAGDQLGPPRCIFASARSTRGVAFSFDGSIAVLGVSRSESTLRRELIALDSVTGALIGRLGDVEGHLDSVGFAPRRGDARLLAVSNRTGGERPLVWDVSTGARTDLDVEGLTGDVHGVDWSRDADRVLLCQLEAAVQRVHLYDLKTETLTTLPVPSGTYRQLCFASDDTIYSLWESSTTPPRVVAIDAATGALSPVLSPAASIPACHPWRSIRFRSSDGQEIQGWLAQPAGTGPFPTILHLHGGPEAAMLDFFYPSSQMWVDHGFAFLTINYRGSTTFGREFLERIWGDLGHWEVEDMVAARQWLIREQIADGSRVFATGDSYGGYLTLQALGTKPDLWAGGMGIAAVADLTIAYEDLLDTLRAVRAARMGGTPAEQPARYAASSPLTHAANVTAPVLLIQGRNDPRSPPRTVRAYEERMKALGKPIEVHWVDAGHGVLVVEQIIEHHALIALRVAGMPAS